MALLDSEAIVSHEHPALFKATLAVHVRAGDVDVLARTAVARRNRGAGAGSGAVPWRSKALIAKELSLFEGADCYYCVGGPRRYIALEDATAFLFFFLFFLLKKTYSVSFFSSFFFTLHTRAGS